MGRKIFVSYKYADNSVQILNGKWNTQVHDYVAKFESMLQLTDHMYCGEHQDEDLSGYSENTIYEILKDKIFPTSCTIVFISPRMVERNRLDKSQWIPWEIYYSLRMIPRGETISHRNGVLGVVLPDSYGCYNYAVSVNQCCNSGCRTINRDWMFNILKKNMFNRKQESPSVCSRGDSIYHGESSYIPLVTWDYFINHVDECVERVERLRDQWENYNLHISVNAN